MQPYSVEENLVLLQDIETREFDAFNIASDWLRRYTGQDRAEMLEFHSATLVITLRVLSQRMLECASYKFDPSCLVSSMRAPAAIILCPLINVTHFAEPNPDIAMPTISVTDVLDIEQELQILARLSVAHNHTVVAGYASADDVTVLKNRGVRVIFGKHVRLIDSKYLTRSEQGKVMGFTGKERSFLRTYDVYATPAVASLFIFPVLLVRGDTVVFANGAQDAETTKAQYRNIFNKT